MPELSRFEGIVVKMVFNDFDKHHMPHIHVYCGEYEASVALDGVILAGSLPARKLLLLRAWMLKHKDELYVAWNKAVREIPFGKIEPLR